MLSNEKLFEFTKKKGKLRKKGELSILILSFTFKGRSLSKTLNQERNENLFVELLIV